MSQMALKVVEAVEDDAKAVASSLNSLLDSLQGALSEVRVPVRRIRPSFRSGEGAIPLVLSQKLQVTGSTVEHMRCHSETAGEVQAAGRR